MIKVLVCEDSLLILSLIEKSLRGIEAMELKLIPDLVGLISAAESGIVFDLIFFDGFLAGDDTTSPFVLNLAEEKYPHLKGTKIFLMSTDEQTRVSQKECLAPREVFFCKKKEVAGIIRRALAGS